MADTCGDFFSKFRLSSLDQLLNFTVFLASLVLAANNGLSLNYEIEKFTNFETNFFLFNDVLSLIATIYVMMNAIGSPFEEQKMGRKENLSPVVFLVALLVSATSHAVDDPSILFSSTFSGIDVFDSTTVGASTEIEVVVVGNIFVEIVNFARLWVLLVSLRYVAEVVYNSELRLSVRSVRRRFRSKLIERTAILIAITVTTVGLATNLSASENYDGGTVISLAQRVAGSGSLAETLASDSFAIGMSVTVVIGLLVCSAFITVTYKNADYALACLLAAKCHVIYLVDSFAQDGAEFDVLVASTLISSIFLTSALIDWIMNGGDKGDGKSVKFFVDSIPSLVYRVGIVLMCLSVMFIFIGFAYDWIGFKFSKGTIGETITDNLEAASAKIDQIGVDLHNIAAALDPCTNSKSIPPEGDVRTITETQEVDAEMLSIREEIALDPMNFYSQCIPVKANPYTIDVNIADPICRELKDSHEQQRTRMRDDIIANQVNQYSYTESSKDDDNFVNRACINAQCNALTAITATALAISAIPFVGTAGYIMSLGGRALHGIFKIGRKITKFGPKIRKKIKVIKKLTEIIKKLSAGGSEAMRFSLGVSSMFLPVVIAVTVALAVVMFKRDMATQRDTGAVTRTTLSATVMVFLPIALINWGFFGMFTIIPSVLQELADELPSSLLKADVFIRRGYTSMRIAYLLAAVGSSLVLAASVIFAYNLTAYKVYRIAYKAFDGFVKKTFSRPARVSTKADTVSFNERPMEWIKSKLWFLVNWNSSFLQPLIFSFPVIIVVLNNFVNNKSYLSIGMNSNSELTEVRENILETTGQSDQVESIAQATEGDFCGIVANLLYNVLGPVLKVAAEGLGDFNGIYIDAMGEAAKFIELVAALPIKGIALPLNFSMLHILGVFVQNLLIYGAPIVCTGVLVVTWWYSMKQELTKQQAATVAMFLFTTSIMNIFVHNVFHSIIRPIDDFELPYIRLTLTMKEDYYYTQLCSVLNLMSSIVIVLNMVLPIPTLKGSDSP